MSALKRRVVIDGIEYETNGCTCVPDGDWGDACVMHDVRYQIGGGPFSRFHADLLLWVDIWRIGQRGGWIKGTAYFFVGATYFAGVRLCGWAFWTWRFSKRKVKNGTEGNNRGGGVDQ